MTLFDDTTETPAAPEGPLVRVRMTVAYDGTGFHGFAPNPGVPTVGGTLRDALEKGLRAPVELTCAGRTDTGVHAWGQVISFDAPPERFDPLTLQRAVNRLCGPAVVVRDVRSAAEDFDALLLPGGQMNPDALRLEERVIELIEEFDDAEKPIAAICHGPWLLVEADIVDGRTVTGWPSIHTDLENAGGEVVDREVAVDGNLITSRKPEDIPAFSRALIEALAS